jgi:hypothetical protein
MNMSLTNLDVDYDTGYYYCSGRNDSSNSTDIIETYFVLVVYQPTSKIFHRDVIIENGTTLQKINLKPTDKLILNMTTYEQKWIFLKYDLVTYELLADDMYGSYKKNIEYDKCSKSITVTNPILGIYISIGINFNTEELYYLHYVLE